MERSYLDYNATSPLAPPVKKWLAEGDFFWGNSASTHQEGQRANALLKKVKDSLFSFFHLSQHDFHLSLHSGATEGNALLALGFANHFENEKEKISFHTLKSDHPSIIEIAEILRHRGHEIYHHEICKDGSFNEKELIETLKLKGKRALFLTSWANGESGVYYDLSLFEKIKEESGCTIILDAAQSVGKLPLWSQLSKKIDGYTFSAHKFGALKGVGFSFFGKSLPYLSMMKGGGQQYLRGGTVNVMGAYSSLLALEDIFSRANVERSLALRNRFEALLKTALPEIQIVAQNVRRMSNTTNFIFKEAKADLMIPYLDLHGFALSSGSACSSGTLRPSRVLLAMGHSLEESSSSLRMSFEPTLDNFTSLEALVHCLTDFKRLGQSR